ncbi:MAG: response regulator, partial [Bacteroidetes bacterium]|nr:response regulator [Bacteroidota bacterium]
AALEIKAAESKQRRTIANFSLTGLVIAILFALILWNRFSVTRKQKLIIEKANEKLQSLDQLKSTLFTNISHEFRTPLTVITGMAQQIRHKPEQWLDKGSEMILRNGNQLLNLVNQILELRKLEAGSLQVNLVHQDLIAYLRYIFESFHSLAESKDITMSFTAEPTKLMMDYDPEKIIRIISNLFSNAIKFTNENGHIDFTVNLWEEKEESFIQIKIDDNGQGIKPESLPYIFDRFYQVPNSSNTNPGEGTGIGLALVKELVELMGGRIEVSSEEGKGSVFSVILPISSKAQEPNTIASPAMSLSPAGIQSEVLWANVPSDTDESLPSVLIIEDNPDVVTYLATCLEESYQVIVARNGQEGIDKALEVIPDLIISDVMMPLKDGLEICNTLKKDPRTSHIPIILLTAKADIESRLAGFTYGANAYLTKPFNQQELLIRMKNLLDERLNLQARYQSLNPIQPTEDIEIQKEDEFIIKVRELITKYMGDENFNVTILCKELGMSRSLLHKKMKALTGNSISHLIRTIRLDKARELLLNSDLQIGEIAYMLGFSDPGYLTRLFIAEFGKNPRDVRKEGSEGISS